MDIEGTVCTLDEVPGVAECCDGAQAEAGPDWMGVGEREWSTELDYGSYAAEELRELIRGSRDRG